MTKKISQLDAAPGGARSTDVVEIERVDSGEEGSFKTPIADLGGVPDISALTEGTYLLGFSVATSPDPANIVWNPTNALFADYSFGWNFQGGDAPDESNSAGGSVIFNGGAGYGAGDGGSLIFGTGYGGDIEDPSSTGNGGDIIFSFGDARGVGRSGLFMPNLPTSNPAVNGAAWNDAGVVKISSG